MVVNADGGYSFNIVQLLLKILVSNRLQSISIQIF
jgi:hypothetical protein